MINFSNISKKIIIINYIFILFLIILIATRGINIGIDFAGGISIEISTKENLNTIKIQNILPIKSSVQNVKHTNNFVISFKSSDNTDQEAYLQTIKDEISNKIPDVQYIRTDHVGPAVGRDLLFSGISALFFSFCGIFIYLALRFNMFFAIGGTISLINDIIIVIGFFSITRLEFTIASVAALLTIAGYSINDSVVIYDKIRELISHKKETNHDTIINHSINTMLKRTIMTSLTTIASIVILIFFTNNTIPDFSWPILIGIIAGTASSIFLAPIIPVKYMKFSKTPIANKS